MPDVSYFASMLSMHGSNVLVLIAIVIMLIVVVIDKIFGAYVKGEVRPLLANVVGMLTAFVAGIASGQPVTEALLTGLVLGTSASGFWSLIGKEIMNGLTKNKKASS